MWDLLILNPMVNGLLWFYGILGQSYILAILAFTLLTRLILLPLTLRQQKSTTAMQELQPKMKKLQEKYKDDPENLQRETMALYKEAGVNPVGGCLPTLIQFPILIGLYQAITQSLAASPVQLIELSKHIYHPVPVWLSWLPNVVSMIPLNSRFLWLNLAAPDPYYALPILVFVTTWLQNKMMTPPSTDPQQVAMGRTMQWMMPIMIGWISVGFPSGLSIYWVIANVVGFAQYAAMGKASLKNLYGTEDGSFSWRGLLGIPGPTQAQPVDRLKERSKSRKSSSKSSDKSSKSKQEQSEEK